MAWAIDITGNGEYLQAPAWQGLDEESFYITLDLHELNNNPGVAFDTLLTVGRESLGVTIQLTSSNNLRVWVSNSSVEIDATAYMGLPIKIGVDFDEPTLNVDIYINDVFTSQFTTGRATRYISDRHVFIGNSWALNASASERVKTISMVGGSGVYDRLYDATASDHTNGGGSAPYPQPILVDTVGGNDATGVNFPTDNLDYWINLGGGSPYPWWLFQEEDY